MNASPEEEIVLLKALSAIQSADISALLCLLSEHHSVLSRQFPELPDLAERFTKLRNSFVHLQLEHIELTNPELAARLQQTIDEYCKTHPFDYE